MPRFKNFSKILLAGFALGFLLHGFTAAADAPFYQWVDNSGVINLTNDAKRVPPRYADAAETRDFEAVKLQARVTKVEIPAREQQAALQARLEQVRASAVVLSEPNPNQDCDGTVTITHERRDYEERGQNLNSMFFVVRNACGAVTSVTREQPISVIPTR